MNEISGKRQIRYGLISVVIGLFNIGYAFLVVADVMFKGEMILKPTVDMLPQGGGTGEIGFGLYILFLAFLIIPAVGAFIGFVFGAIGVAHHKFYRPLGVAGILLNLVIPGLMFLTWLYVVMGAPGYSRT